MSMLLAAVLAASQAMAQGTAGPPLPGGRSPVVAAPAPRPVAVETHATPRRALASYFGGDDYPAPALSRREEGITRFYLAVGANGRVTDCRVTAGSGSAALDDATCRILRSRARFTPARGARGEPVADLHFGGIAWRLAGADRQPEVLAAPAPAAPPAPPAPRLAPTRGAVRAAPAQLRAVARAPLQSLISAADYPASALAGRDEGQPQFRLAVGPDGRVAGCVVLVSSGSPALDDATCRIMRSRARFSPARDLSGRPVPDEVFGAVAWRLPRD